MKFTKMQDCSQCLLKCDIYRAMGSRDGDCQGSALFHAHYRKHEVICKQGTDVTHAKFLVKGTAKLYIEGLNNRNIILYLLKPPAYIGLLAFFESPYYSYSVAALEDAEVCFIDLCLVKRMYVENHELLLSLNQAFGKSVANIMKKIISLNQKQIRGRLAENLIYLSKIYGGNQFRMALTRKEIGEMTAISEENTVRLLSEFSRENIISTRGREIEILDMPLLEKISEFG